ncbi:hypothetical protein [Spiroplasma endosymbiont of Agriotes lineatus]|uniref:hypothetical protein n=1 Tax=Spiroplasma endosymbiont of Agriotes lineatus TaxID=3077930 RepID=UPI0030CCD478
MKFLNITALLGITTLPIVGCSKKENKSVEQNNKDNNKDNNFEIKDLEKVSFLISKRTNNIIEVKIDIKNNININEKLPELKNLNKLIFTFPYNQIKQNEIKQLINKYGQKIDEDSDSESWIINKKITIKVQGTNLIEIDNDDNTINYRLDKVSDFNLKIEK